MEKRTLLGMSPDELREVARQLGMPAFTGSQIAKWLYVQHASSIDEMTNISKANRERLKEQFTVGAMPPVDEQRSVDGTVKYLFPVLTTKPSPAVSQPTATKESYPLAPCPLPLAPDTPLAPQYVETVYIPDGDRATLCVSCQVGCKMNCLFCQTGKQGFQGQLTVADILNQIYSLPERDTLTNIVFMGQGEPMDNLDNVLRATQVLTADWGWAWSPKRITVSSVGVRNKLQRFLDESQCHVAISLHSPLPEQRARLMPAERGMGIEEVVELLRHYDFAHQRRLTFEYIVFGGENDTPRHAQAIVSLLRGLDCRINLIRFHQIPDVDLHGASEEKMVWLRNFLTAQGITTTIRASRGQDIYAACGLLTTAHQLSEK